MAIAHQRYSRVSLNHDHLQVQFSERKNFKAQEEKIQTVFENLTQLEHPNIVKFHRYWTDTHNDKPRVSRAYGVRPGKWCFKYRGTMPLPCASRAQTWHLPVNLNLTRILFQVIFITEYMSSGSLKQFLKRTKRNVKKLPLQAWKRWCTQILSALR